MTTAALVAELARETCEETIPVGFEDAPVAPIPAAACRRCGGWTPFGGMSQYADATEPVLGRVGCTCHKPVAQPDPDLPF